MSLFSRRTFQLLLPTISIDSSSIHFQKTSPFTSSHSSSFSSKSKTQDNKPDSEKLHKNQSFIVSYLINSLGFSPQVAHSLSNKKGVRFESPHRPDSVIKLLKHHGFTDLHVSEIVKKRPDLLCYNAQTLKPKLELFTSVGISGNALADIISGNPKFLTFSLEENLRPCLDIIRGLPIPERMVDVVLSRLYQGFNVSAPLLRNIAPNIEVLRAANVLVSSVKLYSSTTLFTVSRETRKFKENLERVLGMGVSVSVSSSNFINALYVLSALEESTWVRRMELYKMRFGWNEDDFFLVFRKAPMVTGISEKLVLSKVDFFVEKMGWEPALVAASPSVLTYSLEKWIKPRCLVIRVLLLKGLIKKDEFSLGCIVATWRNYFVDRFVTRYQEQVPELLVIFQGKTSLADVGLAFEETDGAT